MVNLLLDLLLTNACASVWGLAPGSLMYTGIRMNFGGATVIIGWSYMPPVLIKLVFWTVEVEETTMT